MYTKGRLFKEKEVFLRGSYIDLRRLHPGGLAPGLLASASFAGVIGLFLLTGDVLYKVPDRRQLVGRFPEFGLRA